MTMYVNANQEREYRVLRNGVTVGLAERAGRVFRLYSGDLWGLKGDDPAQPSNEAFIRLTEQPYAEEFEEGFEERLQDAKARGDGLYFEVWQ